VKLYCLSGLGVDERAFRNLNLPEFELIHIPWIHPLSNESLADYSKRLFDESIIDDDSNLLGVSFGGMVAMEFAKIKQPKNLFLISTIHSRKELPTLFKIGGWMRLHKIVPSKLLTSANFISYYLFGVKQKEDRSLLKEILRDTDPKFLKWAMSAILTWTNTESAGYNIHGTNDKILPLKRSVDVSIHDGGHFMIVTKADEISAVIMEEGV